MKIKSPTDRYRHPKGSPAANWLRAFIADKLHLAEILPDTNGHFG